MNRLAALLTCLVLAPLAAGADPPGRVGRLAWIEGEVSVFADADPGWERAGINSHLTSENSVWTEPGARAEVRVGAIALRLEEATQLDIAQLDDETLRAHVMRGSLAVRVRYFEKDESITITTPSARFQVRGNGRYRIDADAEGAESRLTVFSGNARLETYGGYVHVETGRSVRVTGGEQPSYQFEPAQESAIDEWAIARDSGYSSEGQATRYVSPRMTGWEDLDTYGEWRNEPDYGAVWYPTRVAVGWAPYRYGRWSWVRPWGWTWVDDAPWGYAPFHYGRWAYIGTRWGWYPGQYVRRPVWAPALVGWVGRPGWSVSVSTGPLNVVGWYPLSPYDRYQPWYNVNTTYVTNINRVVIVNRQSPRHHYNRDRGATVVPRDHFTSRRPVQSGITRVPPEVIAAQPIVGGTGVLPPRDEGRGRPRPADRNSGTPVTKPVTVPAQAPTYPSAPSSKPVLRPQATPVAPSAPASQPPARPVGKPTVQSAPAPQPMARPVEKPAAPYAPAARPVEKPAAPYAPAARPVEKPTVQSAPASRSGGRPIEGQAAPAARSSPPAMRPVEKPAVAAPAAPSPQPAARPVEKPAAAQQDRPAGRGVEKPGKSVD